MKKLLSLGFAVVLAAGAAVALAHTKGDGPIGHAGMHPGSMHEGSMHEGSMHDMVEHLTKMLGLTDDQQAAAQKLHDDVRTQAAPLIDQYRQQMEEIHTLLDGDNVDATELGQKMIAAHATRQQLSALHEAAFAKFRALLTPDQQAKLDEMKSHFKEHHGGMPGFGFGPEDE